MKPPTIFFSALNALWVDFLFPGSNRVTLILLSTTLAAMPYSSQLLLIMAVPVLLVTRHPTS